MVTHSHPECFFGDELRADARYECLRCGKLVVAPNGPRAIRSRCLAPGGPTFVRRIGNFSRAYLAHVCNRQPTCDQAAIDGRLAICETCPLFSGRGCTHKDCGCPVSADPAEYFNKLAWADQQCPRGLWPMSH